MGIFEWKAVKQGANYEMSGKSTKPGLSKPW